VGSVFVWNLAKNMCGSLQNFLMLFGLDFIPSDQIANMSLNVLRRQVTTRDKTLTGPQMDELSIKLDSRHLVSARGTPLLSLFFLENHLCEDLSNHGFAH
jgi:hypothetical protein